MILLPGLASFAGTGDGEFGDNIWADDVSYSVEEPDDDMPGLVEPAPQPGSSGSTSHAIVRITAEQTRAARDRECRRRLME